MFDISWRLTFHDVWHFMTFVISWHLSFDISWLLTFHNIWHFITFNVKWDFISFEISCNLTFHVIWVFISFEISCTIWDFMSFEFSWNLRFHVIWDWEWRNLKLIQMWRNFSFLRGPVTNIKYAPPALSAIVSIWLTPPRQQWSLVSFWLTPPPPFVSNGQHLPMSEVRVTTLTARVLRV